MVLTTVAPTAPCKKPRGIPQKAGLASGKKQKFDSVAEHDAVEVKCMHTVLLHDREAQSTAIYI